MFAPECFFNSPIGPTFITWAIGSSSQEKTAEMGYSGVMTLPSNILKDGDRILFSPIQALEKLR